MLEIIFNPNNNRLWSEATMWLYLGIILIVGFSGYFIQNNKITINTKLILIIPSFCILFFFSAFRTTGADTKVYKDIFIAAGQNEYNTFLIEPGYWVLNKLLSIITNIPQSIIIFTTFLTLFFLYKTLKHFKKSISIGVALFAFVSIFYFQSYNLARIYLTAAFLLFSFKYLYEGKNKKYAICVSIAVLFHYSAILMFFPFVSYFIYKKNKKLFYVLLILFFLTVLIFIENLHYFNIFIRYSNYLSKGAVGSFGIAQFIFHLPFLLFIYFLKKKICPQPMYDLFVVYTMYSLMFSFLFYKIIVLGRISVFFNVLFIIIVPYFLMYLKQQKNKKYISFSIMFTCYLIFRCIIYFREYLFLDEIIPYSTIF